MIEEQEHKIQALHIPELQPFVVICQIHLSGLMSQRYCFFPDHIQACHSIQGRFLWHWTVTKWQQNYIGEGIIVKLVSDLMSSYQTALSVGIKTSLSLVDHDLRSWEINVNKG